jgi:hypothetical protein
MSLISMNRCLGGKVQDFPDLQTARKVGIDFTLAAARAFLSGLCPILRENGQKFRFVFCSGRGAEWNQDRNLWYFAETRKLKGAVERGLLDIDEANREVFQAVILRPGGVLPDESVRLAKIAGLIVSVVPVSELARALIAAVINPPKDKVIENEAMLGLKD